MTEHRASFNATIKFSNGGDLTAHGFRIDVPSPDMDEDDIAALFVASLGLLMTDSVTLPAPWQHSTWPGGQCCCTPATTRGSARRPTPKAGTS